MGGEDLYGWAILVGRQIDKQKRSTAALPNGIDT